MKLSILGATGSIGLQTLDVVRSCLPDADIVALSGYSNMDALALLVDEFKPQVVWVPDGEKANLLREKLSLCRDRENSREGSRESSRENFCEILIGEDGLISCAAEIDADVVVNALVGRAGLAPTLAAINAGKNIALANKETLVSAGELVMSLANEKGVRITPIDSEHSAIWQCLGASEIAVLNLIQYRNDGGVCDKFSESAILPLRHYGLDPQSSFVEKIILTASGGPFRGWERERISAATAKDALKHPNWDMGAKITIDSATLMNKGLELIEAMHLFSQPPEKIEILVHPQSIIHSMVQFCDGSVVAQMGLPDMRLPILYALSAPERVATPFPRLDFLNCGALTFEPPNLENFPCLSLAVHAAKTGGTLPAVMNFINEWAVGEFLQGRLSFYGISEIIDKAFGIYNVRTVTSLDDVREAEHWAAEFLKGR